MYKVFFNERFVTLTDKLDPDEVNNYQVIHPFKDKVQLKEMTGYFQNNQVYNMAVLFEDVLYLKKAFFSMFSNISAAGGLVLNGKDQFLMIYRREKWDLPKGKAEKSESTADTALREVSEETGLSNLELMDKLCDTYHTYKLGTEHIIKDTTWYLMKCNNPKKLVPQEKEDITVAKWVNESEVDFLLQNSFGAIRDVFEKYRRLETV